jgi:hypothetical protein
MVFKAFKIFGLCFLALLLSLPALAQNTKGDRPAGSSREARFKTPKKSKQKRKPGRRVKQNGDRPSNRAAMAPSQTRKGERPGRPIKPMYTKLKPRGEKQKAWRGDITGRRIRARPSNSARNVYPQPRSMNYSSERGPGRNFRTTTNSHIVRKPRRGQDRPASRSGRIVPRSASGTVKNVFSQKSLYVNNKSHQPAGFQATANKSALARLKRYPGPDKPRFKSRRIVPRSASSAYIARRSTNTWAHFARPKKKGERAFTKDLAGNKLRTKNFETRRPQVLNPTLNYKKRIATGERPYEGPAAGGYISRTKRGERAWKGDVANRSIRGGKLPKNRDKGFLGLLKGGGFRSATQSGERRAGRYPLTQRNPSAASIRMGKYQGDIKSGRRRFFDYQGEGYAGGIKRKKPLPGGGSVSGKAWNNRGVAIQGRAPGRGADRIGTWRGNIRAGRKGFSNQGEGYAGNIRSNGSRGFNNQGEGYTGDIKVDGRRGFTDQGEEYTGNIKARRPDKGGGTRSGNGWNNNNMPIAGKPPASNSKRIGGYQGNLRAVHKGFGDQGEGYTGNIKARRPEKGGGSVSGKLWNNDQSPVVARDYSSLARRISKFPGNLKAKKPEKGGGSVSGKLWNNNESPIVAHDYSSQSKKMSKFSGNLKAKKQEKGGGSVSGKLWNNNEQPIVVRLPKSEQGGEFSGNLKVGRNHYTRNKNSDVAAVHGVKASKASIKAGEFSSGVRRNWDFVRNPSSAKESQRVREPGKAFARSADYQGNIKMRKFELFGKRDLHPDSKFVKLEKNNVPAEKDVLTNFKLWWARLFRKNDTQPDHLKEKEHKPRYDKGESDLWYE